MSPSIHYLYLLLPFLSLKVSRLTGVFGLEVCLALQRGWQVVEAERQLSLKGGVLLAQSWKSPEGSLAHQLLNGRVAARDGMRASWFWALQWRCRPFGWGSSAWWERWDGRRQIWGRGKQGCNNYCSYTQ